MRLVCLQSVCVFTLYSVYSSIFLSPDLKDTGKKPDKVSMHCTVQCKWRRSTFLFGGHSEKRPVCVCPGVMAPHSAPAKTG